MTTCSHCEHLIADTDAELDLIDRNVEAELYPCITAACGHRLCAELDDHPPCTVCGLCEQCCPCVCEPCGARFNAREECWTCLEGVA